MEQLTGDELNEGLSAPTHPKAEASKLFSLRATFMMMGPL